MTRAPFCAIVLPLLVVLALSACGDREDRAKQRDDASDAAEGLPAPAGSSGVTGTADIAPGGSGTAPVLGKEPPPEADPMGANPFFQQLPPLPELNPETGLAADPDGDGPLTAPPAVDTGAAEPTPADAVAVIRDYYVAIDGGNYAGAYRLWEDGGAASGQTPEQFAAGFAQTRGVVVEIGGPGRVDAGAGNRHIQVPVAVASTQADGSVRRFAGTYTLHRSVVEGVGAEQRNWRIRDADLREVQP